jgi:hypothetical protein
VKGAIYQCNVYAAIITHPDIVYAVQTLSQFNTNPGPVYLTTIKYVYCYLCGTPDLGITYSVSDNADVEMHADFSCPAVYTDADWANSKDDR